VEVLGIVPARGGSRRVPGKNLARIGGRTLVRRALETSLASGALAALALTSEDDEILAEADGLDGVEVVCRPPELSTDTARSFDVILHALAEVEKRTGDRYDAIAVMQCTSPFTAPDDVKRTIDLLANDPDAGSAVSVMEVDMVHHPIKLKRIEEGRLVPFLEADSMTPSHELPRLYVRNGSVYVSRRTIIDGGVFVAEDALAYEMPEERSLDVDTPLDLEFAEFLEQRRLT
jgi:CMP-N,N'-diacetyllegionaminic acid synthase